MPQYWVVGATWGGQEDQSDIFLRRGYWFLGYDDQDQPDQARRRDQMQSGDRIAIKRMLGRGSPNVEIRAIGIIREIDPDDKRVYVDWVLDLRDENRVVPSKGCYKSVHGPFPPNDEWTNEVFRI